MSTLSPQLIQHLQQALAAFQAKNHSACLKASEAALRLSATQADALHFKALSLGYLQRDGADKAFTEAAKYNPRPHEVLHNYANYLRRAKRLAEAEKIFRQTITSKPDFAEAYYSLAQLYLEMDDAGQAETALRQCLALKANHSAAAIALGGVLSESYRAKEAIDLLKKIIAAEPQNVLALNNLGAAYREAGDLNEALVYQQRAANALKDTSDKTADIKLSGEVTANLARAYQRLGRQQEAYKVYLEALEIDPTNSETHRDYNRQLWERGENKAFLRSFDPVLSAASDEQKAELLMVKASLALRAGKVDAALDAARATQALFSQHAEALALEADILSRAGEGEAAETTYRKAMAAQPTLDVLHEFAEFLLSQSRFDEARTLLDEGSKRQRGIEGLQKQIALQALALRGCNDEAYQLWYDYDLLTAKRALTPPPEYGSLEEFMAAVEEGLEPLFETENAPLEQTLFNGVQSPGHLWDFDIPVIQALRKAMFDVACGFVADLPYDENHPFLKRRPAIDEIEKSLMFTASWSVKLRSGGGHVDHIHPRGWISSAHYVRVPKALPSQTDNSRGGWLRLGASGVRGLDMPAERYIRPDPGHLVLFPSYLWHGVEPYTDAEPRITTPVDLVPASLR